MTLISDMATKLISLGYATALGTDIFAYRFPPSPINCICLFLLRGQPPTEIMGSAGGIDRPGVQVQCRNTGVVTAQATAEAIRKALAKASVGNYAVYPSGSGPIDLTNPDDLATQGGPAYRFSVDFKTIVGR